MTQAWNFAQTAIFKDARLNIFSHILITASSISVVLHINIGIFGQQFQTYYFLPSLTF